MFIFMADDPLPPSEDSIQSLSRFLKFSNPISEIGKKSQPLGFGLVFIQFFANKPIPSSKPSVAARMVNPLLLLLIIILLL